MKGLRIFSAGIYLLKLNNKKLKEQCVQYVTGFYVISASVMKGLRIFSAGIYLLKLNNKKLKEQCVQYVKR